MMWTDPTGAGWGGAPKLHLLRARMPWPDLLFKDFIPLRDLASTKDGTRHERPQSETCTMGRGAPAPHRFINKNAPHCCEAFGAENET